MIEAAYELFDDKGFDNTTVDEIARAAGVSRRTFFRYFGTKEAVCFPRSAERIAGFRALLKDKLEELSPPAAVREACLTTSALFADEREQEVRRTKLIEASPTLQVAELEVNRRWEREIADAVAPVGSSHTRRQEAALLAAVYISLSFAVLREWRAEGGKGDLVQMGRDAFLLLESGFGGMQAG